MRRTGLVAALVVVLTGLSAPSAVGAPAGDAGRLSGVVRDPDGAPVSTQDVCVHVEDLQGTTSADDVRTDARGAWSAIIAEPGSHRVEARLCPGTVRDEVGEWYGGAFAAHDAAVVTLSPAAQRSDIGLWMHRTATISGRVLGHDGSPLGTACVVAGDRDGFVRGSAEADDDGRYVIAGLAPRPEGYGVRFSDCPPAGVEPHTSAPWRSADGAAMVVTTAARPAAGIDGRLALGGRVAGTLRDVRGRALDGRGLCVDLGKRGDPSFWTPPQAEVGADGTYAFAGLPAGTDFVVSAGPCPGSARRETPAQVEGIETRIGTTSVHDVALFVPASISGRVVDAAGAPMAGICIGAFGVDDEYAGGGRTDAQGRYVATGVRPGRLVVRFRGCTLETLFYAPVYLDGAGASRAFDVGDGGSVEGIDGSMRAFTLATTVADGPPPTSPTSTGRAEFRFTTDVDGARFRCSVDGAQPADCDLPYVVEGLAGGAHELRVNARLANFLDGPVSTYRWSAGAPDVPGPVPGEVPAGPAAAPPLAVAASPAPGPAAMPAPAAATPPAAQAVRAPAAGPSPPPALALSVPAGQRVAIVLRRGLAVRVPAGARVRLADVREARRATTRSVAAADLRAGPAVRTVRVRLPRAVARALRRTGRARVVVTASSGSVVTRRTVTLGR